MNLCIDIGNTRSKYAVFDKEQLVTEGVWRKISLAAIQKVEKEYPLIQRIIVSTVTLLDKKIKSEIQKNTKQYLLLNHKTPIPIQNKYETPKTLGKDRLSAVVGAHALFPGRNCLVIDAGTCIKYDFINAKGIYRGGSISPGVQMRLKAMHHFTSKLPLVKVSDNDNFIGKNTREAILSGAQHGALSEIKGMLTTYIEKYGRIKVIITGGDAIFFANRMKRRIFVSPNIVLIGLNRILSFNQ